MMLYILNLLNDRQRKQILLTIMLWFCMVYEERVGLTQFQWFIVGNFIIFLDSQRLFDFLIQLFVGATSNVSLKFHTK